jgi:hypothetical protein
MDKEVSRMFEDFRKQAETADFPDEFQEETLSAESPHKGQNRFLGLTPVQRFIIALMLMFMITILGILFLMVTEKIVFPTMG